MYVSKQFYIIEKAKETFLRDVRKIEKPKKGGLFHFKVLVCKVLNTTFIYNYYNAYKIYKYHCPSLNNASESYMQTSFQQLQQ